MIGQINRAALAVPQQPGAGAAVDQHRLPGPERGRACAGVLQRAGNHRHTHAIRTAPRRCVEAVTHRPVRVGGGVLHHPLRRTRDADQVSARKLVQLSTFHRRRAHRPADDQPGRGQVEHRCSCSPTRTYSAAVDRSASTALLPACPLGRINENTNEPINPVITISTPISTARD